MHAGIHTHAYTWMHACSYVWIAGSLNGTKDLWHLQFLTDSISVGYVDLQWFIWGVQKKEEKNYNEAFPLSSFLPPFLHSPCAGSFYSTFVQARVTIDEELQLRKCPTILACGQGCSALSRLMVDVGELSPLWAGGPGLKKKTGWASMGVNQ